MTDTRSSASDDGVLIRDLKERIAKGKVLAIVGTGVSIGATKNARAASWHGLLESGIDRCIDLELVQPDWGDRRRGDLASGDYLLVADSVAQLLRDAGEYQNWLADTIGQLRIEKDAGDVLEALKELNIQLATTNYDGLIEDATGLEPVTWLNHSDVEQVVQGERAGILHLHGYWKNPESVVFDNQSYQRVINDPHAQAMLQGLRTFTTLLYVGFGAGLSDPNFDRFLGWTRTVFGDSPFRNFRLARESEKEKVQSLHNRPERIFAMSYGKNHEDLAPFLRALIPIRNPLSVSTNIPEVSLPPQKISNIPFERNLEFTGRDAKLDEIAANLGASDVATVIQATSAVQAIHGLGGIGKTQLAVEFAYRHAEDYDIVWWVRAEDAATLATDYASLANELRLPEAGRADQALTISALRRWLEAGEKRWLLIFDNVNEQKEVAEYLPKHGGHVLLTSRNRRWSPAIKRVEVDVLDRSSAADFLLKRVKQKDEEAANELAEELGDLPLALSQAVAFIDEAGHSLASYLEIFHARKAGLLQRGKPDDYPSTVAVTWEISFAEAARQHALATPLMNLLAFMAPESIPLDLILATPEVLPDSLQGLVADPLLTDDAIAALRRFSLIVREDRVVSVHRLVQFVARDRLSEADRRGWALAAVQAVNASFPNEAHDVLGWPVAARLLSHGLAVTALAEEFGTADPSVGQLLNRVGRYLTGRALYAQAEGIFRQALAIHMSTLGENHVDVAMDLNDLGVVLQRKGDLAGARERHERALAIREAALGPNHPEVATSLNNLTTVLQDQGDLAGARERLERALTTAQGCGRPSVLADVHRTLSRQDLEQGRLSASIRHLRDALRIDQALGRKREEAFDFLGLANVAAVRGRRSEWVQFLILRWLILRDIGDPGATQAKYDVENALPPQQRQQFEARAAVGEAAYRRDGGKRAISDLLRRL